MSVQDDSIDDAEEDFKSLFAFDPDFAYGEQTIHKIQKCRRRMENELFIDRLLKTLSIKESTNLYPPRSNRDLRDLHREIIESPSPDHHKQSVLYYILRDIPSDKDTEPASSFAKSVFLPEKYRIFIDGIWFLDRGKFEKALEFLTEPVLIPTFPEEIIYTLCTHPDQHDIRLPLAYYYTVMPAVTSSKVLEALFTNMAKTSVTEAFFWSRKQGASIHQKLFEQLISIVLDTPEGEDRARRSVELIYLPFEKEEERWFEAYLTDGEGRKIPRAKDALGVRGLAIGRTSATTDLYKAMEDAD
ncbi:MAG: hypothetical protein Q9179_007606, partial [Wetmoreana sp. 5 TL-2023]